MKNIPVGASKVVFRQRGSAAPAAAARCYLTLRTRPLNLRRDQASKGSDSCRPTTLLAPPSKSGTLLIHLAFERAHAGEDCLEAAMSSVFNGMENASRIAVRTTQTGANLVGRTVLEGNPYRHERCL